MRKGISWKTLKARRVGESRPVGMKYGVGWMTCELEVIEYQVDISFYSKPFRLYGNCPLKHSMPLSFARK
ncbi:MAG: hypothetical protein IIU87_00880 [Prevotella sp.]|nr:hypothetical protein [Prevotella sp.]MBQ5605747.1 hypothetical protein [Prevotella sp.]